MEIPAAALAVLVALSSPANAESTSPLMATLAADLVRDGSAAEDAFWRERGSRGSPIVESIAGDGQHRLVTFLWHGDPATKNAVVVTPLSLLDFSNGVMARLPGSNVWYRTYQMPGDALLLYRFAPDDSLVPFAEERNLFGRMKSWQPDPFNRETFSLGPGFVSSVLRLDGAPARRVAAIARNPGRLREASLASEMLHGTIAFTVYEPGVAGPGEDRPLLVFLDGDSYLGLMDAAATLDALIEEKRIPPAVAVFVHARESREADYDCNADFSAFLARELVPFAARSLRVSRTPSQRAVAGYSLGGLAATCAAMHFPDVFGNVIAQSGSFYRPKMPGEPELVARTLSARSRLPVRLFLEIGQLEHAAIPSLDPSMLTATRHLRDILRAKGYPHRYAEHYAGHEQVLWKETLPDALIWAVGARPNR
jgi:enterochelin esterase-like enzyme